jgi:hypothetical protein
MIAGPAPRSAARWWCNGLRPHGRNLDMLFALPMLITCVTVAGLGLVHLFYN